MRKLESHEYTLVFVTGRKTDLYNKEINKKPGSQPWLHLLPHVERWGTTELSSASALLFGTSDSWAGRFLISLCSKSY